MRSMKSNNDSNYVSKNKTRPGTSYNLFEKDIHGTDKNSMFNLNKNSSRANIKKPSKIEVLSRFSEGRLRSAYPKMGSCFYTQNLTDPNNENKGYNNGADFNNANSNSNMNGKNIKPNNSGLFSRSSAEFSSNNKFAVSDKSSNLELDSTKKNSDRPVFKTYSKIERPKVEFLFVSEKKKAVKPTIKSAMVRKTFDEVKLGPLSTRCPTCNTRNIEYFDNLKPDTAVRLLKYAKEKRGNISQTYRNKSKGKSKEKILNTNMNMDMDTNFTNSVTCIKTNTQFKTNSGIDTANTVNNNDFNMNNEE